MLKLIIDTSTERALVAVLKNDKVFFEEALPFGLRSSDHLFPILEKVQASLSLSISDFSSIIVATGPGSYTGIRVGASVAKAFAFACDLSLIGVSTLHAFAPSMDGRFAVLIDAKVSGVYWISGERLGDKVTFSTEPAVSSLKNLVPIFDTVDFVVGPNFKRLRPLIEEMFPNFSPSWEEMAPLASLYAKKAKSAKMIKDFSQLELMYLRKTQAELELLTRTS